MRLWTLRLLRARARKRFTSGDWWAANSWTSCALSEYRGQFAEGALPDGTRLLGVPLDFVLVQLGTDFFKAITSDDVSGAQRVYRKIQAYFKKALAAAT